MTRLLFIPFVVIFLTSSCAFVDQQSPDTQDSVVSKQAKLNAQEEALSLFGAQGPMGQFENKDVLVNVGRFGPYVKWGDDFISLPKGTDLGTIDFIKAVEYIKAKQKADAPVETLIDGYFMGLSKRSILVA